MALRRPWPEFAWPATLSPALRALAVPASLTRPSPPLPAGPSHPLAALTGRLPAAAAPRLQGAPRAGPGRGRAPVPAPAFYVTVGRGSSLARLAPAAPLRALSARRPPPRSAGARHRRPAPVVLRRRTPPSRADARHSPEAEGGSGAGFGRATAAAAPLHAASGLFCLCPS